MKLLTVKVFDNAIEAHIWKSKLEEEGILCFLFDENIVNIYHTNLVGGVKLKIREQDIEQAKQVFLEAGDEAVRICPNCLSVNVQNYSPKNKWKALWLVLTNTFSGKQYQQCQDCETVFL